MLQPSVNKPIIQQSLTNFFKPKPRLEALLAPVEEEDIFEDINSSDDEDSEFDALVEAKFKAEDNSI